MLAGNARASKPEEVSAKSLAAPESTDDGAIELTSGVSWRAGAVYILAIALISLGVWLRFSDSIYLRGLGAFYIGTCFFLLLLHRYAEVFADIWSGAEGTVATILKFGPMGWTLRFLSTYQYTVAILLGIGTFVLSYWTGPISTFYAVVGAVLIIYGLFSIYRYPEQGYVTPPETLSPVMNRIAILAGAGCVAFYFLFIYRYGLNIPFYDEYWCTLPLILQFNDLSTPDKYEMLLSQWVTHRILTARLVILLLHKIMGHTDYRLLMFVGFGLSCTFSAVLYRLSARRANRLAAFVPVIFLLYQIQYHQLILWGTMIIVHLLFLLFTVCTVYFIGKRTYLSLILAILSASASLFSLASGMFVLFVVLIYLVYEKRLVHALIWLLSMTASLLLFFHEFTMPVFNLDWSYGTKYEAMGRFLITVIGSSTSLGHLTDWEGYNFYFFFGPAPRELVIPAVIASILAIGIMALLTLKRFFDRNAPLYLFVLLIFMNLASLSVSRYDAGASAAFFSRYALYSALIFAGLYMAIYEQWPSLGKRHLPIIIVITLIFNIFTFQTTIPYVKAHNGNLLYGLLEATVNIERGEFGKNKPAPLIRLRPLRMAIDGGHYRVPYDAMASTIASSEVPEFPVGEYSEKNVFRVITIGENKRFHKIQIGVADGANAREYSDVFTVLSTDTGPHVFGAESILEAEAHLSNMIAAFGKETHWISIIPKEAIDGEKFQLSIYGMSKSGGVYTPLGDGVETARDSP